MSSQKELNEVKVEQIAAGIRAESPADEAKEQAARRVWARV